MQVRATAARAPAANCCSALQKCQGQRVQAAARAQASAAAAPGSTGQAKAEPGHPAAKRQGGRACLWAVGGRQVPQQVLPAVRQVHQAPCGPSRRQQWGSCGDTCGTLAARPGSDPLHSACPGCACAGSRVSHSAPGCLASSAAARGASRTPSPRPLSTLPAPAHTRVWVDERRVPHALQRHVGAHHADAQDGGCGRGVGSGRAGWKGSKRVVSPDWASWECLGSMQNQALAREKRRPTAPPVLVWLPPPAAHRSSRRQRWRAGRPGTSACCAGPRRS